MGVAFCTLFLARFLSGIVMMYCRFPRVEAEDRLSRAAGLDPALQAKRGDLQCAVIRFLRISNTTGFAI
jgi:DNA-directed RNA polymerase subunit H (RpoH/RPB5)